MFRLLKVKETPMSFNYWSHRQFEIVQCSLGTSTIQVIHKEKVSSNIYIISPYRYLINTHLNATKNSNTIFSPKDSSKVTSIPNGNIKRSLRSKGSCTSSVKFASNSCVLAVLTYCIYCQNDLATWVHTIMCSSQITSSVCALLPHIRQIALSFKKQKMNLELSKHLILFTRNKTLQQNFPYVSLIKK